MVQHTVETFGTLDILHANAGRPGYDKAVVYHGDKERNLVMGINLTGVFYLVSDASAYLTGEALNVDGGMMAGFNFLMPPPG